MSSRRRGLTGALFGRSNNADDLSDKPPWRVGISMAATWSWGAAVAVAIAIMHTKGLVPFAAWAVANCIAIPAFGLAYVYLPGVRKWKKTLPMLLLWAFIGFFAIVMNLAALKAALGGGTDLAIDAVFSEQNALYITLGVGVLIAWFIHKTGLRGSVKTDVIQLSLQFLGAIGIIGVGLATGERATVAMNVGDQSTWMVTGVLGLLAGGFASGMQWQRLESLSDDRDKIRAALTSGGIFTVFLSIVTVAGAVFWTGSALQTVPFLLAVLAVATSTSDSGSALLQYVSQRFSLPAAGGSVMTLAAVAAFPFVADMGVTAIWTFYASVRWMIVAAFLGVTFIYYAVPGLRDWAGLHAVARRLRIVIPDRVYGDAEQDAVAPADD